MKDQLPSLATIGYEGALLDDFIATLKASSVRLLIDVRALPISRRKGFAKGALSTALEAADICYLHLRGLGDPKPGGRRRGPATTPGSSGCSGPTC